MGALRVIVWALLAMAFLKAVYTALQNYYQPPTAFIASYKDVSELQWPAISVVRAPHAVYGLPDETVLNGDFDGLEPFQPQLENIDQAGRILNKEELDLYVRMYVGGLINSTKFNNPALMVGFTYESPFPVTVGIGQSVRQIINVALKKKLSLFLRL